MSGLLGGVFRQIRVWTSCWQKLEVSSIAELLVDRNFISCGFRVEDFGAKGYLEVHG